MSDPLVPFDAVQMQERLQSFDPAAPASRVPMGERVTALRGQFDVLGVDGVLVPHDDEYQNENLPKSSERLAFLTGFTGSSGSAIVLSDKALFYTDGRYTLQAEAQVDGETFAIASTDDAARDWMKANLDRVRLGFDPMLHSRSALKRISEHGAELVPLTRNPVDAVWSDRPEPSRSRAWSHPIEIAGETSEAKIAALREDLGADAVILADSASVSWLMNWRGADVPRVPLVQARAFVPREGPVTVFAEPSSVAHLAGGHAIVAPEAMLPELRRLAEGITVAADPTLVPEGVLSAIEGAGRLVERDDPAVARKAVKNAAEIAGMRAAHRRDGAVMVRFLAWFERHAVGATEIDLVKRLEDLRRAAGATDLSFDTIAGAGPNGAIVHYRVDRGSNRRIAADDPVLVDSGAQYPDGTTDITRTIVAGTPLPTFQDRFTRVLKGHVAIARQRFPEGTLGSELDPLARAALWQEGLDYRHGTGHGVGAHLGVHEGPCGLSKRARSPLKAGMILSNEPGYYEAGAFGIRIENLYLVVEAGRTERGATLAFEPLTACPIDTRLINPRLLTASEVAFLDAYHAWVHGTLVAELDAAERAWLAERCRPLA